MYFYKKMENDDDGDDNGSREFETKYYGEIDCISHVEIKEEVIKPENISDGESTLSDNEKNSDSKLEECGVCCKYRSMFIILKNHDCRSESNQECRFCTEISHWSDCFKSHRESHLIEKDFDRLSDSTASDQEENEGNCKICMKYEFMLPLLKNHVCQIRVDSKCPDCSEVMHWMTCYQNHVKSHETKDFFIKVKEENLSDSTVSDNEEIQKLLSNTQTLQSENCEVCLKYQGMFFILYDNHKCHIEMLNKNCKQCSEIIEWYDCFDKHKKTHEKVRDKGNVVKNIYHFSKKFDCGICLKLNSIVTHLVKNHKCIDYKKCDICQEVSYWLSCLKNHKQSETISDISNNEEVKTFNNLGKYRDCTVCSKFRFTLSNLCDHICIRRRGRRKCEICLEVSFWFKNFRLHEKHHSTKVSALKKFFLCSTCGKRFSGDEILNLHKSYYNSSRFTCDICSKTSINTRSLKKQ